MATKDDEGVISLGSVGNISLDTNDYSDLLLLAILNSKFISWYAYRFVYGKAIRTMRFDNNHLEKLPFPKKQLEKDEKLLNKLELLSNMMLDLRKKEMKVDTAEKNEIQKRIEITDKEIDDLILVLYGISDDERKIIENA